VSWEKVGITFVAKPSSTGGGLKVRIPKKTVDAYDLWTAEAIEVTIDRAKRREARET